MDRKNGRFSSCVLHVGPGLLTPTLMWLWEGQDVTDLLLRDVTDLGMYSHTHTHARMHTHTHHHRQSLRVEYDGPPGVSFLWVLKWLKRTILEPQTLVQCGHGCEVPGVGYGGACLVVNLSFLCCCLSFAACRSCPSWNVAPFCRQFLQVDLCRAADVCPLLFPADTQDFSEVSQMVGLQSS